MSTLQLRDATPDDIPVMLTLSHAGDARGANTPPLHPATFSDPRYRSAFDEITADPSHRLIVAEINGEIIGTLQISYIPGLPNLGMKRGMLENVHVRADHRGSGYGKAMVECPMPPSWLRQRPAYLKQGPVGRPPLLRQIGLCGDA